ncbi:oxygen-independent coproporphyrinogen-3 oxidase [Caldanaerobius fijiensis DSM 17918]|uniref:Heme chaperone HemW n=1 Tax=Caldanaerobius fijiensis DSM 17918 TaxID=1121256 RepID=A0A1M4SFX2_9THEO|nr:radical SAM family heme chaperone HemW [Caldanaerobius fijiensis]SHE31091.1 oxygen-independent coproporphyrinogen-3 oxidase [Caldanaerobius fijiensis DSM 17918]
MNDISLYIHIPFCLKKCYYCDFNSYPGMDDLKSTYVNALIKELYMYSYKLKGYVVRTVFIGGGTPTTFTISQLSLLLNTVKSAYNIEKGAEITIEANPGTLSRDMLYALSCLGVNRLSIGLQAVQDDILKSIGRVHTYRQFLENYNNALAYFDNINIDLMFGLPFQTVDLWLETLDTIIALKPQHLSCYSLILEEHTPMYDMVRKGVYKLPDEETERQMYYEAKKKLRSAGYRHYEISNFALPGYECRHNMVYWTGGQYVGVGVGASSYYSNIRYKNVDSIEDYIDRVYKDLLPIDEFDYVDSQQMVIYAIITGLRLIDGINLDEFRQKYRFDIEKEYGDVIEKYSDLDLLEIKNGRLKFTEKGIDVSNTVLCDFLR